MVANEGQRRVQSNNAQVLEVPCELAAEGTRQKWDASNDFTDDGRFED